MRGVQANSSDLAARSTRCHGIFNLLVTLSPALPPMRFHTRPSHSHAGGGRARMATCNRKKDGRNSFKLHVKRPG